MWLFLSESFVSVVADRADRNRLLVRSRLENDIPRIFSCAEVFTVPNSDYKYRAFLPREYVAKVISDQLLKIEYINFKDSVEDARHDAYFDVWSVMRAVQK